jgi:hypothetical membrane protein
MPRVAISLATGFALLVVALHLVRTDVDPLMRGVSRYAIGEYGYVVNGAFLLLAAGLVATGMGFRRIVPAVGGAGVWLLWASAAGMATVAIFPVRAADSAALENLPHQAGGMVFFLTAAAGAVVLSRATRRQTVLGWSVAAAVTVYFLSIGVPGLALTGVRGLLQRVCFAAIVAWLVRANAALDYEWRRATVGSTPAARLEGR